MPPGERRDVCHGEGVGEGMGKHFFMQGANVSSEAAPLAMESTRCAHGMALEPHPDPRVGRTMITIVGESC
eukprot:5941584-Alexandrium_andersonii.AAC.1